MIGEFISDVAACVAGAGTDRLPMNSLVAALSAGAPAEADGTSPLERFSAYIYSTYHCRGGEAPPELLEFARPELSHLLIEEDVQSDYEDRVGARCYLEPGFQALDPDASWPRRFEKEGLYLRCREDEVEQDRGPCYSLKFPRCIPYRSRGFVSFTGAEGPVAAGADILRIYFALDYAGSLTAVQSFCSHADAAGIRYLIKAIGRKSGYVRTDNVVLYIDHKDYPRIRTALPRIASEARDRVVHKRPSIFCKPMWSGIALAEEPSSRNGESFGLHRSRLLAEATARALTAPGDLSESDGLARAVRSRFSQEDVSVNFPYLSYSWTDVYD